MTEDGMGGKTFDLKTYSGRVSLLFHCVLKKGGKRFSYQEVADATRISTATVGGLKTGTKTNPTADVIIGFSTFFGVPSDFILGIRNVEETAAELLDLRQIILLTGINGPELIEISTIPSSDKPMSRKQLVAVLAAYSAAVAAESSDS